MTAKSYNRGIELDKKVCRRLEIDYGLMLKPLKLLGLKYAHGEMKLAANCDMCNHIAFVTNRFLTAMPTQQFYTWA